jgi:hypothetical protein
MNNAVDNTDAEITNKHREAASMFLCWPMGVADLCKKDDDLPEAIEKLAGFIARWEAMGAASHAEELAAIHELLAQADKVIVTRTWPSTATEDQLKDIAIFEQEAMIRHQARQVSAS